MIDIYDSKKTLQWRTPRRRFNKVTREIKTGAYVSRIFYAKLHGAHFMIKAVFFPFTVSVKRKICLGFMYFEFRLDFPKMLVKEALWQPVQIMCLLNQQKCSFK
jgi:hypothetical protein